MGFSRVSPTSIASIGLCICSGSPNCRPNRIFSRVRWGRTGNRRFASRSPGSFVASTPARVVFCRVTHLQPGRRRRSIATTRIEVGDPESEGGPKRVVRKRPGTRRSGRAHAAIRRVLCPQKTASPAAARARISSASSSFSRSKQAPSSLFISVLSYQAGFAPRTRSPGQANHRQT
jgi:hypothetical protein